MEEQRMQTFWQLIRDGFDVTFQRAKYHKAETDAPSYIWGECW